MECLALCESHSLDITHAIAMTVMARIYLIMDDTRRAVGILKSSLPTVLQHGHICYRAEARLTLAKCYLSEAKDYSHRGKSITHFLKLALVELHSTIYDFNRLQDVPMLRELYYLYSQTCHALGNKFERNAAAKIFMELDLYMNRIEY